MSDPTSLINIGNLAEPVTKLIEKISDATGALCTPWQMKRIAKAEVEVAKIKALSDLEVEDIQERAKQRLLAEETIKQKNIENIILKALPEVEEDAKPEEINNDWLLNFIDKSKYVSDEEMQSIWGKILAGEANKKGSFSKRTLEIVSNLETEEANSFTEICEFSVSKHRPLILAKNVEKLESGLTFEILKNLDSIGLIQVDQIGFTLQGIPKEMRFTYFDVFVNIKSQQDNMDLSIGNVLLTKAGKELSLICKVNKNQNFLKYLQYHWIDQNSTIKIEKSGIINKYFDFVLDANENSFEEIYKNLSKSLENKFEVKNIEYYSPANGKYQIKVFLATPVNEINLKENTLDLFKKYSINGYSWS